MMKNKKALAMSVLCAIASVGFVVSASAAERTIMAIWMRLSLKAARMYCPAVWQKKL